MSTSRRFSAKKVTRLQLRRTARKVCGWLGVGVGLLVWFTRSCARIDILPSDFDAKAIVEAIAAGYGFAGLGAVVGGLLVGLVEVFVATYAAGVSWLGIGFAGIVPWLLMMAVLLVKPYGIFGTEEVRRV